MRPHRARARCTCSRPTASSLAGVVPEFEAATGCQVTRRAARLVGRRRPQRDVGRRPTCSPCRATRCCRWPSPVWRRRCRAVRTTTSIPAVRRAGERDGDRYGVPVRLGAGVHAGDAARVPGAADVVRRAVRPGLRRSDRGARRPVPDRGGRGRARHPRSLRARRPRPRRRGRADPPPAAAGARVLDRPGRSRPAVRRRPDRARPGTREGGDRPGRRRRRRHRAGRPGARLVGRGS